MAGYPKEPTEDEQYRDTQDQVRRLWTRKGGQPSDTWHDLAPYLHSGWESLTTYGSPNTHWARFRKEGDRVWLGGTVVNVSAGDGAVTFIDVMPDGYSPGPFMTSGLGDFFEFTQNIGPVFESPDGSDVQTDAYWHVFATRLSIYVYTSTTFYTGAPDLGGVPQGKALQLNGLNWSHSLTAPDWVSEAGFGVHII